MLLKFVETQNFNDVALFIQTGDIPSHLYKSLLRYTTTAEDCRNTILQ